MECSICLTQIKTKQCIKTLSCGHKIHNSCYLNLVLSYGNVFVKCPLCREINVSNDSRNNDPFLDLKELCKIERCNHITKKGLRCKKKSFILNEGCCKIHNKNYLQKEKYEIMREYIHWLLMTSNNKKTKLIMIDIGKKLLNKYSKISSIYDIQYYFHIFYHMKKIKKGSMIQWSEFYDYYHLDYLNKELIDRSINKNCIY